MTIQSSDTSAASTRACSLFVHEHAAVRLIRITHATGAAILTVHGPGAATAVYTCASEWECLDKQRQIESTLSTTGYARNATDERRLLKDRRRFPRGSERRRGTYR